MQQHAENSTVIVGSILQLAESRRMGELLAAYPRNYKVYPFGIALLVVFIVAMSTLFLPFVWSWIAYVFLLALAGLLTYGLLKRSGQIHQLDQLVLYEEGFIYLNGKHVDAHRWEDIKYLLRGSGLTEGKGVADIDTLNVTFKQGKNFKLSASWEKHARADICDSIERHFVDARLPHVIEQYNAGTEIEFSQQPQGLRISNAGFYEKDAMLPWFMVEKAEVGSEIVIIRKEGRTSDWYHAIIYTVPNAALLKALLDYRQYHL